MRILITGAASDLGQAAARHLAGHEIRLADRITEEIIGQTQGIDAVVHLASFDPPACSTVEEEQALLMQATRDTWNLCCAARDNGVERIVVAGTLKIFDAYPQEYLIDEMWRPRPMPQVDHLAPYLAEKMVREAVRTGAFNGVCLRFNPIGDDPEVNTRLADALGAVDKALAAPLGPPGYRWHVIHVATSPRYLMRDARNHLGLTCDRPAGSGDCRPGPEVGPPVSASVPPGESPGIRKVCVIGASGAVGGICAEALCGNYDVRLTGTGTLESVLARGTNEWKKAPDSPYEWVRCDITRYEDVRAVVEGCDAVINLTVNRSDVEMAFRVNVVGSYNVMKAAQECGVKRVIQSGPIMRVNHYEGDNRYEYGITGDAPLRPGMRLYENSKTMGHLLVDAFAREADMDVMNFLISRIRSHEEFDHRDDNVMISFTIAWDDLPPAFLCGLRAPRLARPNEVFYLCAELPMGKYDTEKGERLLGWKAKHTFDRFYHRSVLDTPDVKIG